VLDVDLNRERISLGLKQTTEDPWKALVKDFPVGAIIEGTVTKLVPFGVFVELGDGVEGLVHISEMAKGHVETPDQVTAVGSKVHVKVMDVDLERRRISLSMRSAAETLGITIEIAGGSDEDEGEESAEGAEAVAETAEGADEATEATEAVAEAVDEVECADEVPAEEAAEATEPEAAAAEPAAEEAAEPEAEVAAEPAAEEAPAEEPVAEEPAAEAEPEAADEEAAK
jgi:small subunit ribosomal protein S1